MKRLKISDEEYKYLFSKANFRCEVCRMFGNKGLKRPLCVDHCHKTGRIRGMLCHKCNTAIGLLNDNIGLLTKCINYLNKKEV